MNDELLSNFVEFLLFVVDKPGVYGINKVEDIHFMCAGYQKALNGGDKVNDFLFEFRKFINEHFESNDDHDWVRLIRFYSASDRHSIELFGRLLNEYLISFQSR